MYYCRDVLNFEIYLEPLRRTCEQALNLAGAWSLFSTWQGRSTSTVSLDAEVTVGVDKQNAAVNLSLHRNQ